MIIHNDELFFVIEELQDKSVGYAFEDSMGNTIQGTEIYPVKFSYKKDRYMYGLFEIPNAVYVNKMNKCHIRLYNQIHEKLYIPVTEISTIEVDMRNRNGDIMMCVFRDFSYKIKIMN